MATGTQPKRRIIDVRVGSRVTVRRLELKISRSEVAIKLGLTEPELVSREVGKIGFLPSEIVQLATILGVNISWFFESLQTNRIDQPFDE